MYMPPKNLDELKELSFFISEEFEHVFARLHHFKKQPPFQSKPTGFAEFVEYCEARTRGINPDQENERTIQRAYRYVELRKSGRNLEDSENLAWAEVPIVRTSSTQ